MRVAFQGFFASNGPKLALLAASLIWGTTFPLGKYVLTAIPLFTYLGIRFSAAALMLFFMNRREIQQTSGTAVRVSCIIGVLLFGIYAFQIGGLLYTTAAKASFVSGLYVVLVPFLYHFLFGQKLRKTAVIAGILGSVGLVLLGGDFSGLQNWDFGVTLVLVSSVFTALQIVGISRYAHSVGPVPMAFFQVGVVGVLCLVIACFTESWPAHISLGVWVAVVFMTLFATVLAFYIQCRVQRVVNHTAAAVIMSMECVFGGVLSWLFLEEPFTLIMLAGAVLLFVAMLVAQWEDSVKGTG